MNLPIPEDITTAYLVTHAGCMDGSGCTIMFMRHGGKQENIRYIPAGALERFIKDNLDSFGDAFIIFADVGLNNGPNLERYADILEKRGNCVLIDHHITSSGLSSRKWADVRQGLCGTELLRQYLSGVSVVGDVVHENNQLLAQVIQDHDLWLEKDPRAKDLASYCVFFGQDVFVENFLNRDIRMQLFSESEQKVLAALIRKRDKNIDAILRKVITKNIAGENGEELVIAYAISSEMNVTLLLDTLLKRMPTVNVACQINIDRSSVSLRSRDGTDVSQIAVRFGGGGHKAAAGHSLPKELMNDIIEAIHGE